ncbi:hypothetical protein NliqN6_6685 [Naganishia liquefaciens]|uniref:Major facilitator superfamily (MFS) profile domain-containing protein n=1 Tax=Naganishia liquefaciens TaxID=104408 RepID=A0A8H3U047_9TREE|nr:hypothetical protein NliqN6_6685 [Naganishia liquefaciens]
MVAHTPDAEYSRRQVVRADNAEIDNHIAGYSDLIKDAADADQIEHEMGVRQALRIHKKAVLWSMALSAALIMEGYDVVLIASFYGHPAFLKKYGVPGPEGKNIIPAAWQSGLGNGSSAGGIIGLLINGWASEKFGPRRTFLVAMVLMIGAIFVPVFAESLPVLTFGEVLCGIPWGIFQTLTTAYASEVNSLACDGFNENLPYVSFQVCPIALRHYLTAYINACWGFGILLSSGVVRACLNIESQWAYKIPFCLQWIWPPILITLVWFAPESPFWLVRQQRYADAERSVRRLTSTGHFTDEDVKRNVAMKIHTTELEKKMTAGASYIDMFKGIDRRRTEIVGERFDRCSAVQLNFYFLQSLMVFAAQLLSGQNLIGQGVQFFQQAGMAVQASYDLNLALNAMFVVGTFVSWGLLTRFGRRTLYLSGLATMAVVLLIIGGMGFTDSTTAKWVSGALLVFLNLAYNSTLGPVCYTLVAEISSTRLRAKTISLSRVAYQLMNIICGIIVPRQLSPAEWNWGPKSGLFWAGSAILTFCYVWLRVPETRNRSYGELDLLFENHIPAWRFSKTKVDQFNLDERPDIPADTPYLEEKPDLKTDITHAEYVRK